MISMILEGGKELEAKLIGLERKVAKKIVRSAVRAGSKPILAAAKSNAQSVVGGTMGGVISRVLQVRAMKKQRRGQYAVRIQHGEKADDVLIQVSASGKRAYIPNAIEYGHAAPGRGGVKGAPKDVPALPYMRPAFDSTKGRAERALSAELIGGIERAYNNGN